MDSSEKLSQLQKQTSKLKLRMSADQILRKIGDVENEEKLEILKERVIEAGYKIAKSKRRIKEIRRDIEDINNNAKQYELEHKLKRPHRKLAEYQCDQKEGEAEFDKSLTAIHILLNKIENKT